MPARRALQGRGRLTERTRPAARRVAAVNGRLLRATLSGAVIVGLLVSVGLVGPGSASSSGRCGNRSVARRPRCAEVRQARLPGVSALRLFNDSVGDVFTAPDIGRGNIVTNDNLSLVFGMRVRDRFAFETFDSYFVAIDADANPATGSPSGAEFRIDVSGRTSALEAWVERTSRSP